MQVGSTIVAALNTSAEIDLIVFNDPKTLQKSILSFFYNVSLVSATEVDFRYYAAYVYKPLSGTGAYVSTDWYQIPGKSSGTISLISDGYLSVKSTLSFVDSFTTSGSTNIYPAIAGLKITGKSVGASSGTISIVGMVRDN